MRVNGGLPDEQRTIGLTDPELDWCRANPEVPEAAAINRLYGEKYVSPLVRFEQHDALEEALLALRRIRPIAPVVIDQFYAWVNPRSQQGGEDVPGVHVDNRLTLMVAADQAHLRAIDKYRPMLQEGLGMPMTLYRYERGPEIPRGEIERVYRPKTGSLPPHRKVDTIYALVTRLDTGDEGIASYPHEQWGQTALLFTRREAVGMMHVYIELAYEKLDVVGFRTFINRKRLTA